MKVDRRSIAVGTLADSKYPSLESIYSSISSIPRRFSACALYCSISLPSVLEGSTELRTLRKLSGHCRVSRPTVLSISTLSLSAKCSRREGS
ncbi:hypothetical protein IAS59_006298 [Cryptococcus gattii]